MSDRPPEQLLRPGESVWQRLSRTGRGVRLMLGGARRLAADRRSLLQLILDTFTYRVLRIWHSEHRPARTVRFKDGTRLTYRRDRGDITTVTETWVVGAYGMDLPVAEHGVILDLGANIGATAVYLARRYRPRSYIAVEPVPGNASILRRNLRQNHVPGVVIEAAIGPAAGQAVFAQASSSTQGRLSSGTAASDRPLVSVVTVEQALAHVDADASVALLKLDIEGGEQQLFETEVPWLERIDCVVAELHPDLCDIGPVLERLHDAGFVERRIEATDQAGLEFVSVFERSGLRPTA